MAFTKTKKQYVNILEGRENIKIPDILEKYPKGIHLTGASVIKAKKGDCSAFTFEEEPNLFFFGGKVFTDTLKEWIAEKGGIINVNNELATDKPLIDIVACVSKDGNTYYDFSIE